MNHIVYAHLLLTAFAAGFFFLKKLPAELIPNETSVTKITTEQVVPLSKTAEAGKILFMSKCASCHALYSSNGAPGLKNFEERGPWSDRQQLYMWIRNPGEYMNANAYTRELRKAYNITMSPFPALTDAEIDAIATYINEKSAALN